MDGATVDLIIDKLSVIETHITKIESHVVDHSIELVKANVNIEYIKRDMNSGEKEIEKIKVKLNKIKEDARVDIKKVEEKLNKQTNTQKTIIYFAGAMGAIIAVIATQLPKLFPKVF